MFLSAALALVTVIISSLLKRTGTEFALLLEIAASAVILLTVFVSTDIFSQLIQTCRRIMDGGSEIVSPMLKCAGIAAVTRFCADMCRDGTQSASASSIELAGTVCALGVCVPLVVTVLKAIEGMI